MTKSGVRVTAQDRSANRQLRIADAAISVIAEQGLAGVTHRLVAHEANVSLASTTYYYRTKADIIANASGQFSTRFIAGIERLTDRACLDASPSPFRDVMITIFTDAICHDRQMALAWSEIELGAARQPKLRESVGESLTALNRIWLRAARTLDVHDEAQTVRSAIDMFIGLSFILLALGVNEKQVHAVLAGGSNMAGLWKPRNREAAHPAAIAAERQTVRARRTRDRILDAATNLLVTSGPSAVTFRSVAEELGLTAAAPAHHFPKLDLLLAATHDRMFSLSKERQRHNITKLDYHSLNTESLIDFTTTVFIREATEYGALNTASYTLWLESARRPELRKSIWNLFDDQCRAWQRLLDHMTGHYSALDPTILHTLYIGKLIRILATGSTTTNLSKVRREFAFDITRALNGEHWMTPAAHRPVRPTHSLRE